MRGSANLHGTATASGPATTGPYQLTICGIPLNPIPPRWQDMLPDFGP